MKFLLSLVLLIAINCSGQKCKEIDSLRSFHGVRFGDKIDNGIMRIATKLKDNDYQIDEAMARSKNQTFNLTKFDNHSFEVLFLRCNKKKEVFSFMLSTSLSYIDSAELSKGIMPTKFATLIDKLQNIFGGYHNEKISVDSILKIKGTEYKYTWACKKTKIECSIGFGGVSFLSNITLIMTDIELDRLSQLENIK